MIGKCGGGVNKGLRQGCIYFRCFQRVGEGAELILRKNLYASRSQEGGEDTLAVNPLAVRCTARP